METRKNSSNIYPLMRVKDGVSVFQVWYQSKYKKPVHYSHMSYKFVWITILLTQKIVENTM